MKELKNKVEGKSSAPLPGAAAWPEFPKDPPPATKDPACTARSGKLHDVGPGKAHETPTTVPWNSLGPGDTVRIFHRPEPYRSKILLSNSGTADAPIVLCGVPSLQGERPILDGEGAQTPKTPPFAHESQQDRGVIIVSLDDGDRYGTRPSHIVISGLEVRHGHPDSGFSGFKGDARKYASHAAGVFIERGEHITLRNSVIRDNANGLFFAAGDEEALMTRHILVEGNYFSGNGMTGKSFDRRHSIYGEASDVIYQYNFIGPQREGAGGSSIKDRSANTTVRYNWIEGGSRQLDLVEPEESNTMMQKEPHFHEAWVYGNVLVSLANGASNVVHFGGDLGMEGKDRKGPLHFYDNTVLVIADEKRRARTSLLQLTAADQKVDIRNNVFFVMPATPGEAATHLTLLNQYGTANVALNLAPADLGRFAGGKEPKGTIVGFENIQSIKESPFVDVGKRNLRPLNGLPRGELAHEVPPVLREYSEDLMGAPRKGTALGALGSP